MVTQIQRKEKIETAPVTIWELYNSSHLGKLLKEWVAKLPTPGSKSVFINTIGDTILGFYKTTELPGLLQKEVGVSADDAQRIVSDLSEFLAPVIAREKMEANLNQAELQELQKTFSPAPAAEQVPNTTPVSQTEAPATPESTAVPTEAHTPVQAMRTMEGDMSRIHGYGAYRAQFPEEPQEAEHAQEVIRSASQEDLLTEKPKLAGMPTYEEKE